jgi:hypothetical protein
MFIRWNLLKPSNYCIYRQFLTLQNSPFWSQCICFVFMSERPGNDNLCSIQWFGFIIEMASIYCAVQTGFLNKTHKVSSLKCRTKFCTSFHTLLKILSSGSSHLPSAPKISLKFNFLAVFALSKLHLSFHSMQTPESSACFDISILYFIGKQLRHIQYSTAKCIFQHSPLHFFNKAIY